MSQVCLPWIIAQSFANDSPAARTALRTQFSQLQRTFPVSMPLRSRQMVAPQSSLKRGMIARDAAIAAPFSERSDETMIAPTSAPHVPSIVPMPEPKPEPKGDTVVIKIGADAAEKGEANPNTGAEVVG